MAVKKSLVKKKTFLSTTGKNLSPLHIEKISHDRLVLMSRPLVSLPSDVKWGIRQLSATQRMVYDFMVGCIRERSDAFVYITQERIANACGVSIRTVQRYVRKLKQLGLVKATTFLRAPTIYQLPICFQRSTFLNSISHYLSSCKSKALKFIMLVPLYLGGGVQEEFKWFKGMFSIKKPYPYHLGVSLTRDVRAREGVPSKHKTRSGMEHALQELIRPDIQEVGRHMQLSVMGQVKLMCFAADIIVAAREQFHRDLKVKQGKGERVLKPYGYFWKICQRLSEQSDTPLDYATVNRLCKSLELVGTETPLTGDYSYERMVYGFDQAYGPSPVFQSPQKGRQQFSGKPQHQSPSYDHSFKPMGTPQPLPMPEIPDVTKPTKAAAARRALNEQYHERPACLAKPKPLGNLNQIGDNPCRDYRKLERHYQQNPEACIAAGGFNPWQEAAQAQKEDIDLYYQLRQEAWRKQTGEVDEYQKTVFQGVPGTTQGNTLDRPPTEPPRTNVYLRDQGATNSPFKSSIRTEKSLRRTET